MTNRIDNHGKWMSYAVNEQSGCWEWSRARNRLGYGLVRFNGRVYLAHRMMWMLSNGDIPDGLLVCHRCDNPGCINPVHLFLGSNDDNMRDMLEKGRARSPRGESNHFHKLSERDVLAMRKLYATGEFSQKDLGCRFGVTQASVSKAVLGSSWGWLRETPDGTERSPLEEGDVTDAT